MKIGIPSEIKNHEYHVSDVSDGVRTLVNSGHEVLIQQGAGIGSGIEDSEYSLVGANLVNSPAEAWDCDMVELANNGLKKDCELNNSLKSGVNVHEGKVTNADVAETFNHQFIKFC